MINQELQIGLAKSYFQAERYDDTAELCRAIRESDPAHAEDASRSLLASAVEPTSDSLLPGHWWRLTFLQVWRHEAWESLRGTTAPDPWQHLIQARGYRLIGQTEQSEAELAAAATAAGNAPHVWMARAQLFKQWNEIDRAEADWQRAVELAGDDPMPWIRRGRWYAQRGDKEQAEAVFAHSASLTSRELNKFLEAGWWVIGPYPKNLAEFGPPELDPDPSRPLRTIDPGSGVSDKPLGHDGRACDNDQRQRLKRVSRVFHILEKRSLRRQQLLHSPAEGVADQEVAFRVAVPMMSVTDIRR